MNIKSMILTYLETIKESKSENTYHTYAQCCYAFEEWLDRQNKDIHDVFVLSEDKKTVFFSPIEQNKYISYLKSMGRAETTIRVRMVVLKRFLAFCADKGYVVCDYFISDAATNKRATVGALNKESIKKIYTLATELNHSDNYVTVRTKLSMLLALLCGFKVSEMCNLLLDDLNIENRAVSDNGIIRYIFNESIIPNLKFYLDCRTEYLAINNNADSDYLLINRYGNKINPRDLNVSYKKFCAERGLKSEQLSFSSMRNMCIMYYNNKLCDNDLVSRIFNITLARIRQLNEEISEKEIM